MFFYKGILGIFNAFLAIIGGEFHYVIQSWKIILPWKLTYPLKNDGWKTILLFEWSLFRWHSFIPRGSRFKIERTMAKGSRYAWLNGFCLLFFLVNGDFHDRIFCKRRSVLSPERCCRRFSDLLVHESWQCSLQTWRRSTWEKLQS